MDINNLEMELDRLNIPKNSYSLKGGFPNESYCIAQNNGKWEVYYSERGNKTSLKTFDSEDSACQNFLSTVKRVKP